MEKPPSIIVTKKRRKKGRTLVYELRPNSPQEITLRRIEGEGKGGDLYREGDFLFFGEERS